MMRPTSPTFSGRWIARELRRLRTEAGLQQGDVAKALGCRVPKVSLMESGGRPVQDDDLKKLLELFDVPAADHQLYLDQVANSHERGWWERYDETVVPGWYARFIGFEDGANLIRAYQPAVVHGLLQTREYALALYRANSVELSEEKIIRQADLRLTRQERFSSHPTQELVVILDEAVLHRVVGGSQVMQAQLEHVVELARSNPRLTVQVVPYERGGAYEASYGAFTILTSPLPRDPGVVYLEHRAGARTLDSLGEIDTHSRQFTQSSERALAPEESLSRLAEQVKAYK